MQFCELVLVERLQNVSKKGSIVVIVLLIFILQEHKAQSAFGFQFC